MMTQQPPKAIDTRRFHFKVGDTVRAIGEAGQLVDELGLRQAETKDTPLRSIKAGAGDGDAVVEAVDEVF